MTTAPAPDQVDWQRECAIYASKSPLHSDAINAAGEQVRNGIVLGTTRRGDAWEATYTLAVQRVEVVCREMAFETAKRLEADQADQDPALLASVVQGLVTLAAAYRTMYDSTSPWDIPRDAEMVAYYVDGRYAWPQSWLDLFPNARKVSISAIGQRTAQVGDVEVGCIWPPAQAVPWVLRARADGFDPTIYVNELNDWLPVRQAFWAAGVPEPHYWVSRYNGVAEVPEGAVARQYAHPHDGDGVADKPWETGKHYDKSAVRQFWPGVDSNEEELDVQIIGSDGQPHEAAKVFGWWDEMLNEMRARLRGALEDVKGRVIEIQSAVADMSERVARLEQSGIPVEARVDLDAVAKAVNDEDDRRDRDEDSSTGSRS